MASEFMGANGVSYRWVDADTFTDGKNRYRIDGYNAPETQKVTKDEDGLRFKAGQLGGEETQNAVERIVEQGGFNNVIFSGETDSFGRERVRLTDAEGNDLTNTLYQTGAIDVNRFTDEEGLAAEQRGRFLREINAKGEYDHIIKDELAEIQQRPLQFKDNAVNENEYLQGVVEVIAMQQGLDLTNPDDMRIATNYALDANYDMRSIPFSGIDFRAQDRTKEGVAYNQTTEAWNQGWAGMGAGLAGFAELAGVTLGSETIETWGRNKIANAKADLLEAPIIRNLDYRDIDSVWDGLDFMINNTAMSAPYMTTLVAGTLLAPVTGGASAVVAYGSTGATYAGQVWNDIEGEKGRAEAAGSLMAGTAMAVLDRLGMRGFMAPSKVLTAEGRKRLIIGVKQTKGISYAAAKAEVDKASKAEIKSLISGLSSFAADNINNSQIMRQILRSTGRGALAEGITEAAQESVGYLASKGMSEGGLKDNFNPNEFTNLLAQASIAGATIGGGLGTAGGLIETGDRYAMQKGYMLGNLNNLNDFDKIVADFNTQDSVNDVITEAQVATDGWESQSGRSVTRQRATRGKNDRGSFLAKIKDPEKYPELFRTAATSGFRPEDLRQSINLRKLYALVGQAFGKLYSGRDVQAEESIIRGDLNQAFNPEEVFKRFGFTDRPSNSEFISDMIRRAYPKLRFTRDKDGLISEYTIPEGTKLDSDLVTYMDAIVETISDLEVLHNREHRWRNTAYVSGNKAREAEGMGLEFKPDGWLNRGAWDWKKVRNNREEWYKWMRQNTAYGKSENANALDDLYNKVSNNENATDFSIVEGVEYVPGKTLEGENYATMPGFEQFANTDILQNAVNSIMETAKYSAYTTYFGAGGKHIDYYLTKAKNEDGIDEDTLNHVAYFTKSIIDSGTGNYNPIKNRKLAFMQRQAAFYSAMVGLPMAAISSVPEFVMAIYQAKDLRDVRNAIVAAIGELRQIMTNVSAMNIHDSLRNVPRAHIDNKAQKRLNKVGHVRDVAGVATRLGLGETDIATAWWQKNFYKWVGIAGITNLQRAISASLATSFISDRIRMLSANINPRGRIDPKTLSQEKLEVYMQLKNLGLDVDGVVNVYNKYNGNQKMFDAYMDDNYDPDITKDGQFIDDQMNTAIWYFVNDRVQNPQAYNRPLFFQDPRFQLLVQFNGFLSTFTANIVPRLWKDYVAKGSPRVQYNTFAMIVTMMAFAGASQWLKDFIKFGGSTPYLNDYQLLQRAIQSAGLLGTGERVLQMGLPMYESRDQGLVDRIFGETVGGSPTLRNVSTGVKAITALGEGNTERAVNHGLKLVPGIAPFTPVRNYLNDLIHGKKGD